jgi:hypothetical protein
MRLGGGQSQGEKADFHRFWSIFAGKQPNLSVFAGFSGHQDTGIADNPEIFQKPYPGGGGGYFFIFSRETGKLPVFSESKATVARVRNCDCDRGHGCSEAENC